MKFKTDFVTNSSSVSFVVMGIYFDLDDLTDDQIEICKKEFAKYKADFSRQDVYRFGDDIAEIFVKGSDLKYSFGKNDYGDDHTMMIGIPYTDMGEDETLRQFKSRVSEALKKQLNVDKKPGHIEAGWESR